MKKLIIATCAAALLSTAASAGPKHHHKHQRHHTAHNHAKNDFHRDLFHFALFAGTVLAIDAALDDNRHDGHHNKPAKPHRPHYGSFDQHYNERPHGQAAKYSINARQERQAKRIRHGVKSGELIRPEAKRLRQQQRRIAQLEHEFRSDGKFTKKERRTIQAKLDKASERIYALKHNDRYRY